MLTESELPLIAEMEITLPPDQLFEIFQDQPYCFFLDSAMVPENWDVTHSWGAGPLCYSNLVETPAPHS
jgi:hypothetical protein